MSRDTENDLNLIMTRLINYHRKNHQNCNHIPSFLEKIGYYRYAL